MFLTDGWSWVGKEIGAGYRYLKNSLSDAEKMLIMLWHRVYHYMIHSYLFKE